MLPAVLWADLPAWLHELLDGATVMPTGITARSPWQQRELDTRGATMVRALLAALGLLDRFAALGGGDSFAVRKPDPGHLLATLGLAGGDRDRAVLVGDHRNDVAAAHGAGIPCAFAAWGYGMPRMAEGAAAVARTPAELPTLLPALLRGHRAGEAVPTR